MEIRGGYKRAAGSKASGMAIAGHFSNEMLEAR
jgi:hypothetical protein